MRNLIPVTLSEQVAPGTPSSGLVSLYTKTDHKIYIKDSTGAETDLTATGTSGALSLNQQSPTSDVTIADGYSAVVPRVYKVTGTNKLKIQGSGILCVI